MAGVTFLKFLDQGTGKTGKPLGPLASLVYVMNAVELQFEIDPSVYTTHRDLRPAQWFGPDVTWIKRGNPITAPWTKQSQNAGGGVDDPEKENILNTPALIAYYDSPGPNVTGKLWALGPTRIHVVQNFTGCIVGLPINGGQPEKLCDVVGWHCVVSIVNGNLADPGGVPRWERVYGNQTGIGWADTSHPPVV